MVSPTKVNKQDKKVCPSKKATGVQISERRRYPIFQKKKCFICLKNVTLQEQFTSKLQSFGAIIAQYIDKDVSYVITHLPGYDGKSLQPHSVSGIQSPLLSISPHTPVSCEDGINSKKSSAASSRGGLLLEKSKAIVKYITPLSNPVETAFQWNIPVYSLDAFEKLIERKLGHFEALLAKRKKSISGQRAKILSRSFLKLEHSLPGQFRPEFKELPRWPCVHSRLLIGSCPFERSPARRKRADKNHAGEDINNDRMNRACNTTKHANAPGYCEICSCHYVDLTQHLSAGAHLKFVANSKNYAELENCIKTRSVEAFLANHQSSNAHAVGKNQQYSPSCSKERSGSKVDDMGQNLRRSLSSVRVNNHESGGTNTRSITHSKILEDESLKQPLRMDCNGFGTYHLRKNSGAGKTDSAKSSPSPSFKTLLRDMRNRPVTIVDESEEDDGVEEEEDDNNDEVLAEPLDDHGAQESGHCLRSRKTLLIPSSLLGTTAEDSSKMHHHHVLSPALATNNHHYLRSASPSPKCNGSASAKQLSNNSPSGKRCRKRLSAEEKLLEDNKAYYKVDVLRSKLRSAEGVNETIPEVEESLNVKGEQKEEQLETTPLRVPNGVVEKPKKKVLNRELSLLNIEAENFMFGITKVESRDEEEEEEEEEEDGEEVTVEVEEVVDDETVEGSGGNRSTDPLPTKDEDIVILKQVPPSKPQERTERRKRRTHTELFINDNFNYYKFEMSGSRLRNHSSELQCTSGRRTRIPRKKLLVPKMEPSDNGYDAVEARGSGLVSDSEEEGGKDEETEATSRPKINIPEGVNYSFQFSHRHEPWYRTFGRFDACEEFVFPTCGDVPVVCPEIAGGSVGGHVGSGGPGRKPGVSLASSTARLNRLKDDRPRKSPRCHASTLAILSSLMRRKNRTPPKKRGMGAVLARRLQQQQAQPMFKVVEQTDKEVMDAAVEMDKKMAEVFAGENDIFVKELKRRQGLEEEGESDEDEAGLGCCGLLNAFPINLDNLTPDCVVDMSGETKALADMSSLMDHAMDSNVIEKATQRDLDLAREEGKKRQVGMTSGRGRGRKRKRPNATGWATPYPARKKRKMGSTSASRARDDSEEVSSEERTEEEEELEEEEEMEVPVRKKRGRKPRFEMDTSSSDMVFPKETVSLPEMCERRRGSRPKVKSVRLREPNEKSVSLTPRKRRGKLL